MRARTVRVAAEIDVVRMGGRTDGRELDRFLRVFEKDEDARQLAAERIVRGAASARALEPHQLLSWAIRVVKNARIDLARAEAYRARGRIQPSELFDPLEHVAGDAHSLDDQVVEQLVRELEEELAGFPAVMRAEALARLYRHVLGLEIAMVANRLVASGIEGPLPHDRVSKWVERGIEPLGAAISSWGSRDRRRAELAAALRVALSERRTDAGAARPERRGVLSAGGGLRMPPDGSVTSSSPATSIEQFRCMKLSLWQSRELCGKRYLEARRQAAPTPSRTKNIAGSACLECPIGRAHARGEKPTSWEDQRPIELRAMELPTSAPPAPKKAKNAPAAPPRPSWMPPIGAPPTARRLRVVHDDEPLLASTFPERRARPEAEPASTHDAARSDANAAPEDQGRRCTTARDGGERPALSTASTSLEREPKGARMGPEPRKFTWKGRERTAVDLAAEFGCSASAIHYRDKKGLPLDGSDGRGAAASPPQRRRALHGSRASSTATDDVRTIAQAQDPLALLERLGIPHELVGETPKGRIVLFPSAGAEA